MSETKKNKLVQFWEQIEQAGDKVKIARAARSLQRQAEIDVAEAHEKYEQAVTNFEKAKTDAKEDTKKGFVDIVNKYRSLQIERKKFDDAKEIYEELFEEPPRLLE